MSDITTAENIRLDVEYYGADFPVDVLVRRMQEGDFIIPSFQRGFVWEEEEASRFIESLLLGLPTPSLFLAKDKFSAQYIVIDGQQRLKTLQYFYEEYLPNGKKFKLKGVISSLNGLTYSELSLFDRRTLGNAIIHCIIISDNYDPRGIFYLFERLNTTGHPLNAQEIRNAIYHGAFFELLKELSQNETWLRLYGKEGKDSNKSIQQELILRFFALYYEDLEEYRGNMVEFLNWFMLHNKDLTIITKTEMQELFLETISFLEQCIGTKVFYHATYHKTSFNKALFESIMYLAAKKLKQLQCETFKNFYELLITDNEFWSLSQTKNIKKRLAYVEKLYQEITNK